MTIVIRNRWTSDIILQIEGANLFRANLSEANLSEANLYGANLYGANLFEANLYGANLFRTDLSRAKGVIDGGQRTDDGYRFIGQQKEDGLWIKAGCRYFPVAQAYKHPWSKPDSLCRVKMIEEIATNLGWKIA